MLPEVKDERWKTHGCRRRPRRRPEDYVSNRNISNIVEEVPVLDKLMFAAIGARTRRAGETGYQGW